MSCQEIRQKLSALADNELDGEQRELVRGHLAECRTCRRDLQDQGALDMLLKSCFVNEPPELTLDGIWPTVSERLEGSDGSSPANGGGAVREGGDIVFKSTSAMQMLRIPDTAAPTAAAGPPAPPAGHGRQRWWSPPRSSPGASCSTRR